MFRVHYLCSEALLTRPPIPGPLSWQKSRIFSEAQKLLSQHMMFFLARFLLSDHLAIYIHAIAASVPTRDCSSDKTPISHDQENVRFGLAVPVLQ